MPPADPTLPDDATTDIDPLAQLDPFAFLMDARVQLIAAVEARGGAEPDRVAIAIGAVIANDHALREVVLAYASGDRLFEAVATPEERARPATIEDAYLARNELFESIAGIGELFAFGAELTLPWSSLDTWRGHLISLAMYEGAYAHALREGEPFPYT